MIAFPAAKRAFLFLISALILVSVPLALAGGDSGYLGVMLQDVSPSMAKALQLGDQSGVLINEVVDDSPAAKAGLEDGDVIVAFEGKSLDDYSDLTKAVGAHKPGTKVTVTVLRDGTKKDIEVELGERENDFAWTMVGPEGHDTVKLHKMMKDGDHDFVFESNDGSANVWVQSFDGDHDMDVAFFSENRGFLGVHLDDLNGQLGEYFGIKEGKGVLVTEVIEESPAAAAGLKAGDVIVKIDSDEVDSATGLHKFMSNTEAEQKVNVHYMRKGKYSKAEVTLGEAPADEFSEHIKVLTDRGHNMHFSNSPKRIRVERAPHVERRVEVIHEMQGVEGDLDEMREELEKMRAELKEMQKELKK